MIFGVSGSDAGLLLKKLMDITIVYLYARNLQWEITGITKLSLLSKSLRKGGVRPAPSSIPFSLKADTFEELKEMVQDAVSCHFDADECPV